MKNIKFWEKVLGKGKNRRWSAGIMAAIMAVSSIGFPLPVQASDIWPQKATAPFYCLDGGKGWKKVDRYDIYKYDTLPSPLTEVQTKRLFWAYPSNWLALKEAAEKYDPELYAEISFAISGPNIVKRVKDNPNTKFAWVADNPEIEARAIAAMEKMASEGSRSGKEAPEAIREATSEETAVSFTVLPFSDGPGALDTEFVLGSEFIRDIAGIEPQSVWDNGSGGGSAGWLDASQDKNIAKSAMGENLYEVTWSGDSIKIHNNGSAVANENAVGSDMSEEEKYNKTIVRYKITMRGNSGWYTEGSWNEDYLHQWMDFKACINSPEHQRLYKADIRIVPSDMVFYIVISQDGSEGGSGGGGSSPEYGGEEPELTFQVYRHEEIFKSNYNVRLKKLDDETGMPLKGSQFYLYEKFEDEESLGDDERDAGLLSENLSFVPWEGFQIFSEGTTDENGVITHTDSRSYVYSKTYCDGHRAPKWAGIPEENNDEDSDGEEDGEKSLAEDQAKDKNRAAAREWMDLAKACEAEAENGDGTHFHWIADETVYDEVKTVLESGVFQDAVYGDDEEDESGAEAGNAFAASGCEADCEETYDRFIHLKFTYTWKEIQARTGYILHDLHADDMPIEMVATVSSEAGAEAFFADGNSREIAENIWYGGEVLSSAGKKSRKTTRKSIREREILMATASNALQEETVSEGPAKTEAADIPVTATPSNAWQIFSMLLLQEEALEEPDDNNWEEREGGDFQSYLGNAQTDGIRHLKPGESGLFSHCSKAEDCSDFWIVRDHRTEGKIHINKRDLDLYKNESDKYSSYGDTEGDGTLEGAVYGLFAAEDIIHPDAELSQEGNLTNTGIVYRKNDLVSMAASDRDGNAEFSVYTQVPGMTYCYQSGKAERRMDEEWTGPVNCYDENLQQNGNYWIGRPLILGKYYIKELSRSEGYELSVNGISEKWTNSGAGVDTPAFIAALNGTAVVSIPEITAAMEGEDGGGKGYNELPFTVTSVGTVNLETGTKGYEIVISWLPENTEFYRVDSGEEEVTGPHVTGTEKVPVRDSDGKQVWKTADSDTSNVKYQPEYGTDGSITGQLPVSRTEPQILKMEQIPQAAQMRLTNLEIRQDEAILEEKLSEHDLTEEEDRAFRFIKSETEAILNRNGYEIPVTAKGECSLEDHLVYSRGVRKGQTDTYGMTTEPGEPAVKTYFGAAVKEIALTDLEPEASVLDIMGEILTWYQNNSQWSFGGIDSIRKDGEIYKVTLYAGASTKASRRFFTMSRENGTLEVDKVYTVLENPVTLRWMYQEYGSSGKYRYQIDSRYYIGSGSDRRYYIDASLTPAVLVNGSGVIQDIYHSVMVYHKAGEEIIDYLDGDARNGYRVPLMELQDKIEITSEREEVEKDVRITDVSYDRETGTYRIRVDAEGIDSFGKSFSDAAERLSLSFMAKLPEKSVILSEADIAGLGTGNVHGYRAGETIGYAEYLMRFEGTSIGVSVNAREDASDTYIMTKQLAYRGQNKVSEDGDTERIPVQVLERPIKQKIKLVKNVSGGEAVGNFRFKLYLKSNLERLFCDDNGIISWVDRNGSPVNAAEYHEAYPELVQKLYTEDRGRCLLEKRKSGDAEVYNYEKFFDAVRTADTDKWKKEGDVLNSSFKPFAFGLYTGIENSVNTSGEAKENAKRSDAVRQFAVTWYLRDQTDEGSNVVSYADEEYDRALYQAIVKAEEYLKPFFLYDIDSLYSIRWDSEKDGGIDKDKSTLSAWQLKKNGGKTEYAYGISEYLPYGDYVLVEQQPFKAEWMDFENRHYEIDTPKEISLPSVYEDAAEEIPDRLSSYYKYWKEGAPAGLAEKYFIRFNEDWTENEGGTGAGYVVYGHSDAGDFKVYPYGKRIDKDSYDGKYAPVLVPWSVTETEDGNELTGFAYQTFLNRLYQVKLRIEKLDAETGEPLLHDDAVFALYKADRDERKDGDGAVKRYERDTVIKGSKQFLEAMGAKNITPFARLMDWNEGAGTLCYGTVPEGTPVCREKDCIVFRDEEGIQTGTFYALSTAYDSSDRDILQMTGYLETPEPVEAGVYVLAELKAPEGYVKSLPVPVEVYSDAVTYYPDGSMEKKSAVLYGYRPKPVGNETEDKIDTARIYVNDTATSLEVSKKKTSDSYRGMKVSGRVEGSVTALGAAYGLENLELAYNSMGTYQGFGWKKGTLEYLESRKASGERVELVYENGIFQGYGYVTRTLETAEDENRYAAGAKLALFEAIEVRPSGDDQDYALEGVEIKRDRNGNVLDVIVKEGYAGEVLRLLRTEKGEWTLKQVKRKDTSVLFYALDGLKVLEKEPDGTIYGYGKDGGKMRITFDTESVYALKGGRPVFEISGGDFSKLVYDEGEKAFTSMDEATVIYHLNEDLGRDAQVDGYTGMAYVEKSGVGPFGQEEGHFYVWPVVAVKDRNGNVIGKEKIVTGRPGEVNAGKENAYITGTWNSKTGKFEKKLRPVLDEFGMVRYYTGNGEVYKKGEPVYDRDGDYLGYRYDDLLKAYDRAAYTLQDEDTVYDIGDPEDLSDDSLIRHRDGEAWIVPNIWISGESTPQDPADETLTWGQPDLLRRVIPGTYIMEELKAPDGYVRALPIAVCVEEKTDVQKVSMTDEKIKVEILKADGAEKYQIPVINGESGKMEGWCIEGKGAYSDKPLSGAGLALYRARRIYTSDLENYPKGYFLIKTEEKPASWQTEDSVDNHPVRVTASWITDGKPKYFEGIPAGDYILEELDCPDGYIPASMEITVKAVPELQSFIMKDDHTKLEIFKYERDETGNGIALPWPYQAELALYPAILDQAGKVQMQNGIYLYDKENPVDIWVSGAFSEYETAITRAYEAMFSEYGNGFKEFSWKAKLNGKEEIHRAQLAERHSTGNQETVTQQWETKNGSRIRITAVSTDGRGKLDENGKPAVVFDYQFNYKEKAWKDAPDMVSYDVRAGLHRIDRIPAGSYVLVETKTPDGYQTAAPKLIIVGSHGNVQRFSMENKQRLIYADKTDEEGNQLSGAKLILYRADAGGNLTEKEEYLVDKWSSGEEGIYTADDLADGTIPDGYKVGDMRIHKLPPIAEGIYYLVEKEAPDYYAAMEPQKIKIDGSAPAVIRAVNKRAKGQIIIEKLDAKWYGKRLPGAWFEVKNQKTGEIFRMITDANGKAVSPEIPVGYLGEDGKVVPYEYQVREIQAPEGHCINLTVWTFQFENDCQPLLSHYMEITDEETRLSFSKSSFKTGHLVPGARLSVYRAKVEDERYVPYGEPVETWISKDVPHVIEGKLSGRRIYFLVEEEAPAGYVISPPVMFTVSADGRRITEITDHFNTIQVEYGEEPGVIEAVSFLGRTVSGGTYTLQKDGKEILNIPMNGNMEISAEGVDGDVLTLGECLEFSDGARMFTERNTFRAFCQGKENISVHRRIPVKTEYSFSKEGGTLIDSWSVNEDGFSYKVINERSESGELRLMEGQDYCIKEIVVFDDGSRILTGKETFHIGENGAVLRIDLKNRETEVGFKKTDITTGEELSGAVLAVKNREGAVLEEWVSGTEEHIITGILNPGETYILSEVMAADGFACAEEIPFTVSEDGCIDKVKMEDKPTTVEIRKTDMTTGKELPGASLSLRDREGNVVDQWISGDEPHRISKTLIAGETYILSEEAAPEGYLTAEEAAFTVSLDGTIDKVVMKDRREPDKPVKPEEPNEPDKPDKPEKPDEPDEPEEPYIPQKPKEPKEEQPEKRTGTITANYKPDFGSGGILHLNQPEHFGLHIPKAGDERNLWGYGIGFFLAAAVGFICLVLVRRRKGEN